MKKRILIIGLVLVLSFSAFLFAGCGNTNDPSPDGPNKTASITAPAELNVLLGERVYFLENVQAKNKLGKNVTHLVNVSVTGGIVIENGYYEFKNAGLYLVTYTVAVDGDVLSAQTRITVRG